MTDAEPANQDTPSSGARHRRRLRRQHRRRIATAIAVVAAALAIMRTGAPTGLDVVDAVYRAVFVFGVSIAASVAKRWAWYVSAGLALALASGPVAIGAGVAALVLALAGLLTRRRNRMLGAVIGACVAHAALGLADGGRFGLASLAAFLTVLPILIGGWLQTKAPVRRRLGFAALGVAGFAIVAGGLGVAAGLSARASAERAVDASRTGLQQLRDGDDAAAAASLETADAQFEETNDAITAIWAAPARLLPVVSQHVVALDDLSRQGGSLARLSADTAGVLDGEGVTEGGRFDLDAMAALRPQAVDVRDELQSSFEVVDSVDSGWLVGPLQDRIGTLREEIEPSLAAAQNAADALELAPQILGGEGTRTYLVLVASPSESRELGGFIGGFGVLTADDGKLDFDEIPSADVKAAFDGTGALPDDLPTPLALARPLTFPINWSAWPDFPVVADLAADLWEQAGLGAVDGVMYVDPYVLAAMLEFTGPVTVPRIDRELDATSAVPFLLRDQYLAFDEGEQQERKDLIGEIAETTFDRLTDGSLPEPRRLAQSLAPLVEARRLLFHPVNPEDRPLFDRLGLTGALGEVDADEILLTDDNLRANKLDGYLDRQVAYDVDVDNATGAITSTLSATLTNRAVAAELNGYVAGDGNDDRVSGDHLITLSLYSPLDLDAIRVDGQRAGLNRLDAGEGRTRYSTTVLISEGQSVTVEFDLSGVLGSGQPYRFRYIPTATANPDTLEVTASNGLDDVAIGPALVDGSIEFTLPTP